MKICFISSTHGKLDKRVFQKEAVHLAARGFDVTHLAPDEVAGTETQAGVNIVTYSRRSGLFGRLLNLPRLYRLAARLEADAYHANELDSWLVGLTLKLFQRKLVVFDVHEFYPSMFAETRFPKAMQPFVETTIRGLYRVLAPRTDAIVLANRHIKNDFGDLKTLVDVENYATLDTVEAMDKIRADQKPDTESKFTLIHVGLFSSERGSKTILEAAGLLTEEPAVRFELIGKIVDETDGNYARKVSDLGLGEVIQLNEWMPYEQLLTHLVAADMGLVFFQPGSQTNALGLPHKLFDYMAAGIPVLVSKHAHYVSEIVQDAECGWIIDSEEPEEIAKTILECADDPDECIRRGQNGLAALRSKYNWETEIDRLAEVYHELQDKNV